MLFRARGSGETPGKDKLGRWAYAAGTALIAKGWRVRDMQADYSAPPVPLEEIAADVADNGISNGLRKGALRLKHYRDVATDEAPSVRAQLEGTYDRCPQRRILLAGYSQGAILLRTVVPKLRKAVRAQISTVDLLGDPTADQRVDSELNHTPSGAPLYARQTGRGLDTAVNSARVTFKQTPYPAAGRITQYCTPYDLVCEVNVVNAARAASKIIAAHQAYDFAGIGRFAAAALPAMASEAAPETQPASGPAEEAPVAAPPIPAPRTFQAQQGSRGVNTFTNPYNASGLGPRIAPAQWVEVACKLYAPQIASVNPDGYWYRIASSPWSGASYAPANTFMNGDPWGGPYTHNTDFSIPDC